MMDGKMLARLLAVIFVAIAITVTAIDMARRDEPAASRPSPSMSPETTSSDPLRDTLFQCQEMGEAATRDADCLAAWVESRRRFLGQNEGR